MLSGSHNTGRIRLCAGDIFVDSEVDVGSTFTVWLPINQHGSGLRVEEGPSL